MNRRLAILLALIIGKDNVFNFTWEKTSHCAKNVLLNERKRYVQHNYLLLCVV